MSQHDPAPGPAPNLLVAFCLALVAAVTAASVVGMACVSDRQPTPYASDCEAVAELCEEGT